MNIPDESKEVVTALLAKARGGEVQWAIGESENECVVNFPENTVIVSWTASQPPGGLLSFGSREPIPEMYHFQVLDSRGYKLVNFAVADHDGDFSLMAELFNLAKRKALNVPGALETLKMQLRKPGVVGSTGSGST